MRTVNLKIVRYCEADGEPITLELMQLPLTYNYYDSDDQILKSVRTYLLKVAAELDDENVQIAECDPRGTVKEGAAE